MSDIKLTDFIDTETLQQIQDGFSKLTGMAAITSDKDGAAVTDGCGFPDFCFELSGNINPRCEECSQCGESSSALASLSLKPEIVYCRCGLAGFSVPIIINGTLTGFFNGGRVFTKNPDKKKFAEKAEELGIDPDDYAKAVKKVKTVTKKQLSDGIDYLFTCVNILAKSFYDGCIIKRSGSDSSVSDFELYRKILAAEDIVYENMKRMRLLSASFKEISGSSGTSSEEVKAASETVKIIQNIAMNTKILAYNASIEAARSKESGKGFGVIAQEVRSLAETSKTSADKINRTMKTLGECSSNINKNISETENIINRCMDDMNRFLELLGQIKTV